MTILAKHSFRFLFCSNLIFKHHHYFPIFGKMLTYFQVKITIHLLNHMYIFNDKAPVISLWI